MGDKDKDRQKDGELAVCVDEGVVGGATKLPDGSAFAVMSMPLPKNHWIYGDESVENEGFEPPPMPMRMGTDNPHRKPMEDMVRQAARYAIRSATMKGKEDDFDPDALVQQLVVGMLGYFTPNGLSGDEWANPKNP
jgi:hypothetical protein